MPHLWVEGYVLFKPKVGDLIFQAGDVVGVVTILEKVLSEEVRRGTSLCHYLVASFLYESSEILLDGRFEGAVLVFQLLERD